MLKGTEYIAYYAMAEGKAVLQNFSAMLSQLGYPENYYPVTTTCANYLNKYVKEVDPYIVKAFYKAGCYEGLCCVDVILDEDEYFYI